MYYELEGGILFSWYQENSGEKMKVKTSTVTQKGQIVIPSKLRRKLGIRQGTQIAFIEEDERLVLQPLTAEYVKSLRGALKGGRSPLKTLFEAEARPKTLRRIVLDASTILVLFRDSRGAETVRQLIVSALHGETQLFMSVINWGEVYYSTWRAKVNRLPKYCSPKFPGCQLK